jgi:hypothetical protein
MSDCEPCAKVHEERNHDVLSFPIDVLSFPISKIRDGWVLNNGDLYLCVDVNGDGSTRYIAVPRYGSQGRRKTEREWDS